MDIYMIEISKALSNETRLNILGWLKSPEEIFPPQGGFCAMHSFLLWESPHSIVRACGAKHPAYENSTLSETLREGAVAISKLCIL